MNVRKQAYAYKKKAKIIISSLLRYLFLIAFSYVLLYPVLYIVVNSFKDPTDYFNPTIQWVPKTVTLLNTEMAVKAIDFFNALKSTFVNEIIAAGLQIFSCSIAAFGLARFNFKGKKIFMGLMILSIMIPVIMTIVPSYANYMNLGLIGTPLVFWLPAITSVGLNGGLYIYIYTQFFKGIPREIEEAAWIDGAGVWKTFFNIVVPSSGVAYLTVSVFSIVWNWNDYYLPQMFLSEDQTLSVKLANLPTNISAWLSQSYGATAKLNIAMVLIAACLIYILPLLIFYVVIQKKFIASVATSGIVG